MASPEAKNLEAISKAIDQHNANCPFPAAEVRMNPFEIERLGWDHIRGLPLLPDAELGTGRFRIVCSRDVDDSGLEVTEAVGKELETVAPVSNVTVRRRSRSRGPSFREPVLGFDVELDRSSPVRIRTPIAIRITPPTATISW